MFFLLQRNQWVFRLTCEDKPSMHLAKSEWSYRERMELMYTVKQWVDEIKYSWGVLTYNGAKQRRYPSRFGFEAIGHTDNDIKMYCQFRCRRIQYMKCVYGGENQSWNNGGEESRSKSIDLFYCEKDYGTLKAHCWHRNEVKCLLCTER
jgi:hypothetical protein